MYKRQALEGVISRYRQIAEELGIRSSIADEIEGDIKHRISSAHLPKKKFLDLIKAAGEDNCARLIAAYLCQKGENAEYVNPKDAGLMLCEEEGHVKILPSSYEMCIRDSSWDDPQTRLAAERYQQTVRPNAPWCPSNPEFIRRINGLDSLEDVKSIVFDASYLVLGLGDVYLGAPVATPVDPRHRMVTTKYNPARPWTPENAVGIGGAYLCVYGLSLIHILRLKISSESRLRMRP